MGRKTLLPLLAAALLFAGDAIAQPVVAVCVAGASGDDQARLGALQSKLREHLESRGGLTLLPLQDENFLFRSERPPPIRPKLKTGSKAVRAAESAFNRFKLERAQRQIKKAQDALAPWIGRPEARDADRRRLMLSVSIAHAMRDEAALERALVEYSERFASEGVPESAPWPPAVTDRMSELISFGNSVLIVVSDPVGGEVFVDGRAVGRSPVTLGDLSRGSHRVVVRAEGYFDHDETVSVGDAQSEVEIRLRPSLSERLRRVDSSATLKKTLLPAVRAADRRGQIDLVIVARLEAEPSIVLDRIDLTDVAPKPKSSTSMKIDGSDDGAIERGIERVLEGLPIDTVAADRGDYSVPTWAWISAGAGAVAIGVGTGLRLSAASDQSGLQARIGEVTQAEAYAIRDSAESTADAGAVVIGIGAAVVVGTVAYVVIDALGGF